MKVLTFGTFDHLHPGHLAYLNEAASKGDLHIIIARDTHVAQIKGAAPDQSEDHRMNEVKEAFPNAQVVLGDSNDYMVPVRAIQPDLIVMGYDQRLPPGLQKEDLPCPVEVASPHNPEKYKSSIRRKD